MRELIASVFRLVTRLEELCLSWGMIAIATLTTANVVARSIVGDSLLFAQEITQFLMIWVTFLGIGYAASQGRHIRMTALYDALPAGGQKAVMLLITATTSALLFVLAWLGLEYVVLTVRELGPVSPVLRVPLHLVYLAAPIGLFLGAVQYALAFARNLMDADVYVSFGKKDEYEEAPPADI